MYKIVISSLIAILLTGSIAIAQGKVDINKAEIKGLMSLPGMTEDKAEAIVRYRTDNGPIRSEADLAKVPGFSEEFIRANPELVKELGVKR